MPFTDSTGGSRVVFATGMAVIDAARKVVTELRKRAARPQGANVIQRYYLDVAFVLIAGGLRKPGRHSRNDRDPPDDDDASADGGHAPTGGSDENRRRIARELEKLPR